jgi:Tol biopolymer transport system component
MFFEGAIMRRMHRSSLLVVLLSLIGGASLWWYISYPTIAFVAGADDYQSATLMIMSAHGVGQTSLATSDEYSLDPAWSPDGQQIAYASRDIFVIQADGTGRRQLTDHATTGLSYGQPAWSPDGTQIAFVAGPPTEGDQGGQEQLSIYVMQADGTNVVQLTPSDQLVAGPSWSPDGQQLVFMRKQGEWADVVIMRLADRSYRNITNTADVSERWPRWSPDGQRIVFEFSDDRFPYSYIAIIRPDGTGYTHLTDVDALNGTPNWSPDGSQIVFSSNRDVETIDEYRSRSSIRLQLCQWVGDLCEMDPYRYGSAIYMMNADGSDVRSLTDSAGWKWSPIWRPASR